MSSGLFISVVVLDRTYLETMHAPVLTTKSMCNEWQLTTKAPGKWTWNRKWMLAGFTVDWLLLDIGETGEVKDILLNTTYVMTTRNYLSYLWQNIALFIWCWPGPAKTLVRSTCDLYRLWLSDYLQLGRMPFIVPTTYCDSVITVICWSADGTSVLVPIKTSNWEQSLCHL